MNEKYFTFKTKDEVLKLDAPEISGKSLISKTETLVKVFVPIIPHFGFIPDLRIQIADCNLYSGYNCIASIGWQLQELFTLICERNGYNARDDGEDLDWFTGREIDTLVIDEFPIYKVIAIGNAKKDNWINLDTWAKDVVQKHMK